MIVMKKPNKSSLISHGVLLLIIGVLCFLLFTPTDCPELVCERTHCNDDSCVKIIRDSIPCPPVVAIAKPCDSLKKRRSYVPIPIPPKVVVCDTIIIETTKEVIVPVVGPERTVIEDHYIYDTIIKTKEIPAKFKQKLWLGASTSVVCWNDKGAELSTALLQLQLDYQVAPRWMIGIGVAHVNYKQQTNLYPNEITESIMFDKSVVTETYSHSTFQKIPSEECFQTIETQYIDRLEERYYDRETSHPYYVNPLDNYYGTIAVRYRLF